jgi:hypothetical protein
MGANAVLTQQGSAQMATKKQKAKDKKPSPPAIRIIASIDGDPNHVQHGRDPRNVRVRLAVPDSREGLHINRGGDNAC